MIAATSVKGERRLRSVQVNFCADDQRRDGNALLTAWYTLSAVAAGTARAGVDVAVVQAAHRPQTLERDGVAYHFVDDRRGAPLRLPGGLMLHRRPARLLERVVSLCPDVVHVHGLIYPLAIRQLTAALPGVPVLVQDHGTLPPRRSRRTAWRWAFQSVAGVAFTAREQALPFFEARALRTDMPVFEVVGGSSRFVPGDRDAARRAVGMCGDPCFLWTSRLDANKDPLATLAAFERAAPRLSDARLWCCFGESPLLTTVEQYIARSPILRERVVLLGRRPHDEMELRFRAADFFVQTSHREASGFSLLEAMSCGTPPLVADIPAARRIVGTVGSLTPVGDAPALADAMIRWASRNPLPLRRDVRARFEQALTFDAIGRDLRSVYHVLASRR